MEATRVPRCRSGVTRMKLVGKKERLRGKLHKLVHAVVEPAPFSPNDVWVREKPDTCAGEIETYFWQNTGRAIDKWLHYLPIYERHFMPFRNRPVRVLEIGVQNGGSAQMWREFFGPDAVIFGVDINPDCAAADNEMTRIRIGSQDDPAFLKAVVAEMGGLDVVIDDGSHEMGHIHASFNVLFPLLSSGGIYLVEDLHTAYSEQYGGGYRSRRSFIETAKQMIDDLHCWYHDFGQQNATTANNLGGLHFYDSIIVVDKMKMQPPRRALTGQEHVTEMMSEVGVVQ